MLDLIFIFLGGILCGMSIAIILNDKEFEKNFERILRESEERKKNASKQRSVSKTTKQLKRPKTK